MTSSDLKSREFQRILLIKLSAVGDVLHTIPVLSKLRKRYPAARIDWLAAPEIAELMRHHPDINNVIEFARGEWSEPWRLRPFANAARLAANLRATRYDLVIDMHGQFRTAVFTLAAGAPVRIGFDRPRAQVWAASDRELPEAARKHAWQGARELSWLAYTHHIRLPTLEVHAVDRYLSIGPMLGLDESAADFSFPIPQAARARVAALLSQHGIAEAARGLIVIAPGTVWETKAWREQGFAEVARHFVNQGFAVMLAGSPRERALCAQIAGDAPGTINLAGQTSLTELVALVDRASLCVTNDSGPMHLTVARGRPVVSIFGPTDPVWIGPYRRPDAVLQSKIPCAPCYLRTLARCPHQHACMRDITATAVIERAQRLLDAAEPVRVASQAFM
ncbi:MAG: putative lipopolysaccharide heptosyltransferase III [Xanthobacteraceae bacterium]|nr:putative lipopolysaccharide heptosyltransferase III [Xanthobacteraceae bacterium]